MLAEVKVDPHAKNQGQMSNGSSRRAQTDKQTDKQTHRQMDATKHIISLVLQSINIAMSRHFLAPHWEPNSYVPGITGKGSLFHPKSTK